MPVARVEMPMRFNIWQLLIICAGLATMVLSLIGCATAGYTDDERAAMTILEHIERRAP